MMKLLFNLAAILFFTITVSAQDGLYIKYETQISGGNEENEMMEMMMTGSTMELAMNKDRSWVRTTMGARMNMEMSMDVKTNVMTMYMSGMIGDMAFRGNPDELDDDQDEPEMDIQLIDQTKKINGITCKKAIITDEEGNKSEYWYTEDFKRPEGVKQMPNQVPGLCLEMILKMQEGLTITYTCIDFKENVDMSNYKINIPDGVEIQSLDEMSNMGMGN